MGGIDTGHRQLDSDSGGFPWSDIGCNKVDKLTINGEVVVFFENPDQNGQWMARYTDSTGKTVKAHSNPGESLADFKNRLKLEQELTK